MLGEATLDALGTFLGEAIRVFILFVAQEPTTAPTKRSNRSSICSPPDLRIAIVELFLSAILRAKI
jgi:hypothetical protein